MISVVPRPIKFVECPHCGFSQRVRALMGGIDRLIRHVDATMCKRCRHWCDVAKPLCNCVRCLPPESLIQRRG